MNKSSKPGMSFDLGANHLHGMARFDQIRTDTLVQLVQHWRSDPQSRDDIIAALDELAEVVSSVRREGELDAAVEQVEDVAGMETAHIEVDAFDVRRLLAELGAVERVTSRFRKGASEIKHPAMRATRQRFAVNPLPEQQDRRTA
ncbi:hypothetical protein [Streptomyces ipomoeae]|uniref:hypothetical protein n=1 Tax=Streptomyces ipomoeae TaxID=103232 RepID=UPI0029BAFCA8|nr:hypothetical protein [Streptomyces ipomoeae]MDX2696034.1 hypothetical protein [Streptomyces ipomoeae]